MKFEVLATTPSRPEPPPIERIAPITFNLNPSLTTVRDAATAKKPRLTDNAGYLISAQPISINLRVVQRSSTVCRRSSPLGEAACLVKAADPGRSHRVDLHFPRGICVTSERGQQSADLPARVWVGSVRLWNRNPREPVSSDRCPAGLTDPTLAAN